MPQTYSPSFAESLVRHCYSFLFILLLPFSAIHFLVQRLRAKAGYNRRRLSRFGIIQAPSKKGGLLIHCASVGEVVAADTLVKQILVSHPELAITITTNTTTGAMRVKALHQDKVRHVYLPYDLGLFMHALLAKFEPSMLLINEMELWPNLIHCAWTRSIPVYLINARMSDKSRASYAKFPRLFRPMFSKITSICVQGQRDYDNYLAMHIPSNKLSLTNNIKFDMQLDETNAEQARVLANALKLGQRPILLAGSTHEPEEEVLIAALKQLSTTFPDLLLIIVPRHPQRFEKVAQICANSGLGYMRLSEEKPCLPANKILLFDQMGILRPGYALAKIAFVGGSIADRGGHNALEPAATGVPILMGSHTYNNPAICQALAEAGALYTANKAEDIVEQCTIWLKDDTLRSRDGLSGARVLQTNGGAITATLNVLGLS